MQVADVRVGPITGIELTDDFHALVTMRCKDDLELPDDSVAVLRQTSLLGEKFIELRPRRADDDATRRRAATASSSTATSITCAIQAPELEFVAEQAVQLLGGGRHQRPRDAYRDRAPSASVAGRAELR